MEIYLFIIIGILAICLAGALYQIYAFKKRYKRLDVVLDRSQQAIMVVNSTGNILFANRMTKAITGQDPSLIRNQPIKEVLNLEQFDNLNTTLQETKKGVYKSETFIKKGGSIVHVEVNILPIVENNKVSEAVVVLHNITERVRYENRLKMSLSELKRRNIELQKLKDDAEAANHAKDIFLSNMSHELRTPLNGILGGIDLIKTTELDPTQENFLEMLKGSGDKLTRMISEILDITQMETGKFTLQQAPFIFSELFDKSAAPFQEEIEKKGIKLVIEPSRLPTEALVGDSARIQQILFHLLSNAVKFTSEGQVTLAGSKIKESDNIVIVHISVTDTGIGIDPEETKIIFTKFTQVDSTSTKKYAGTGHGLYFVKKLVDLMNGTVHVEPAQGGGCCFTFTLPLSKA